MKSLLNLVCFFVVGMTALSLPATAATSQWHELGGGAVRMLATLDPATNAVQGAIEVKLEPGWSTYWRYPGGSGIPPQFDFSQSSGFRPGEVAFPVPKLIESDYGAYAGYKERVVFPFAGNLSAAKGAIKLDLLIGVCSEICIPAQAQLSIQSSDLFRSDPVANRTIQFASFSIPEKKPFDEVISVVKRQTDGSVVVVVRHNQSFGVPELFVEGPENWNLKHGELVSQSENEARFRLDVSALPETAIVNSKKLRFTVVTKGTGIETAQ